MGWSQIWKPESFHGEGKRGPFFYFFYLKQLSADTQHKLAFIPGVFLGASPSETHAFVQVLDGSTADSHYVRFPVEEFRASPEEFDVHIGKNHFSKQGVSLDLKTDTLQLQGELQYDTLQPWPVTRFFPGIMGPYAFTPRMECNHGLLSFDHNVQGQLRYQQATLDFTDGRGYIEKDWGRSFPSSYVWMQSNHFEHPGISLSASVANIPWGPTRFRGFIIGFWQDGKLHPFATYTGARLDFLRVSDQEVHLAVQNRRLRLEIRANRVQGGLLHAPYGHAMQERVSETMNAEVSVRLLERKQGLYHQLFAGRGRQTAMEVQGVLEEIAEVRS